MNSATVSTGSQKPKRATSPRSEVRMLTPAEIASLQRDKAETAAKALAYFRERRLSDPKASR